MLSLDLLRQILDGIGYRDWSFDCGSFAGGPSWLRVIFTDQDRVTGRWSTQYGRRWVIEETATDSDVVRTAWLAVLTAEEHEARESFSHYGRAIFSPHLCVGYLRAASDEQARNQARDWTAPTPARHPDSHQPESSAD